MDKNKIYYPPTQPVSTSEKEEMSTVVNKVIQLIKDKHL